IVYKKDNPLSGTFTTSALLPILNSLSVNEKEVGANAFILQGIGNNFTSRTILRWKNIDLKTTFIDKTNISAEVPRELLAEAGEFPITAFTPPAGGGISNALKFDVIRGLNVRNIPLISRIVPPDKNNHLLYRLELETVGGAITIKEIKFQTTGSYQITDLKEEAFALKISENEILDDNDLTIATAKAVASNGSIIFNFEKSVLPPLLSKNKTSYLLLTVNIAKDAKAGNEIGIASTPLDNINFFEKVIKKGINPTEAGILQKIVPANPNAQAVSLLIKFFNAMGGKDWVKPWNLDAPVNTWQGVELDENGNVIAISLPENNLIGNLAEGLVIDGVILSPNLIYLNLSGNKIKGEIPPNIKEMTSLEYLDLSKNELSGNIPEEISNLSNLVTLWLAYNQFSGTNVNFSRLPKLRNLFLQFNSLDKLPDNIGDLSNLEMLSLKGNKFKTLPSTLANLKKLKYLDISENELEQVPVGVTVLTELEGLLMHKNFFRTIPQDLRNLNKLRLFTTYENFLQFGSLEPLRAWWNGQSRIDATYFPQGLIGSLQDVLLATGSPLTLRIAVTGTANRYIWFKNGVKISESTAPTFFVPSVTAQDAGVYNLQVINSLVPDLVLQSYEISVFVDCGTINEMNKPQIVMEGVSIFCSGETINTRLSIVEKPEITNYQWFVNGKAIANTNLNSILVSSAGRYQVQIITRDGCSLFSKEVAVDMLPDFSVEITQNQGILRAVVVGREINTYEWFLNGRLIENATQSTYQPLYQGAMRVYPNPSESIFYLETGKERVIKVRIFNAIGQFFDDKIKPLQNNKYEINLGNQVSGMFFVEVITDKGTTIQKLIKE
nr:leucine-rich repeat domain-containing protein [Chitinophagaceae bacterium]